MNWEETTEAKWAIEHLTQLRLERVERKEELNRITTALSRVFTSIFGLFEEFKAIGKNRSTRELVDGTSNLKRLTIIRLPKWQQDSTSSSKVSRLKLLTSKQLKLNRELRKNKLLRRHEAKDIPPRHAVSQKDALCTAIQRSKTHIGIPYDSHIKFAILKLSKSLESLAKPSRVRNRYVLNKEIVDDRRLPVPYIWKRKHGKANRDESSISMEGIYKLQLPVPKVVQSLVVWEGEKETSELGESSIAITLKEKHISKVPVPGTFPKKINNKGNLEESSETVGKKFCSRIPAPGSFRTTKYGKDNLEGTSETVKRKFCSRIPPPGSFWMTKYDKCNLDGTSITVKRKFCSRIPPPGSFWTTKYNKDNLDETSMTIAVPQPPQSLAVVGGNEDNFDLQESFTFMALEVENSNRLKSPIVLEEKQENRDLKESCISISLEDKPLSRLQIPRTIKNPIVWNGKKDKVNIKEPSTTKIREGLQLSGRPIIWEEKQGNKSLHEASPSINPEKKHISRLTGPYPKLSAIWEEKLKSGGLHESSTSIELKKKHEKNETNEELHKSSTSITSEVEDSSMLKVPTDLDSPIAWEARDKTEDMQESTISIDLKEKHFGRLPFLHNLKSVSVCEGKEKNEKPQASSPSITLEMEDNSMLSVSKTIDSPIVWEENSVMQESSRSIARETKQTSRLPVPCCRKRSSAWMGKDKKYDLHESSTSITLEMTNNSKRQDLQHLASPIIWEEELANKCLEKSSTSITLDEKHNSKLTVPRSLKSLTLGKGKNEKDSKKATYTALETKQTSKLPVRVSRLSRKSFPVREGKEEKVDLLKSSTSLTAETKQRNCYSIPRTLQSSNIRKKNELGGQTVSSESVTFKARNNSRFSGSSFLKSQAVLLEKEERKNLRNSFTSNTHETKFVSRMPLPRSRKIPAVWEGKEEKLNMQESATSISTEPKNNTISVLPIPHIEKSPPVREEMEENQDLSELFTSISLEETHSKLPVLRRSKIPVSWKEDDETASFEKSTSTREAKQSSKIPVFQSFTGTVAEKKEDEAGNLQKSSATLTLEVKSKSKLPALKHLNPKAKDTMMSYQSKFVSSKSP